MRPLLSIALLALAGCDAAVAPPPETLPGCNPLVGDDCLSPYPSSFYEVADATTATGMRVAIPDGVLPAQANGVVLSTRRLNLHDGISPSTPFVVYFQEGVDPTQLPSLDELAKSLLPGAPVQVIDAASGERVPVLAELDSNAAGGDRQALLIRPMVRLTPATRYLVALVGLRDASGKPLAPAPFVALRDGNPLSQSLSAIAPSYVAIFAALTQAGIPRSSLTLAWSLTTASDGDATAHLVAMRDEGLAAVPSLNWTITATTDFPADPFRLREVVGTFDVPTHLIDDSGKTPLDLDGAGRLRAPRMGKANFVVDLPQCVRTAGGPIPVIVFGHGLFGSAQSELATNYQRQVGNYLCMVQIGTDWIGLSSADLPTLAGTVLGDFNKIDILTGRLQQAHENAQVLARLFATRMKDDPAFALNGVPATDGKVLYYYGISDGGVQGGTFMALSQDVTRGVLNVPGCEWNLMMFRSQDFTALKSLLDGVFPDPLDQQILLAAMQPDFDFTDPAGFAPHLLGTPLANSPRKQILVQEAVNDAQVPNIATRVLVRTIGLPGLDLEQPVFGVTAQAAPLASAYTQWDVTPMPVPPTGNRPASMDNGAHEAVRRLAAVEDQIKGFFAPAGAVLSVCHGPCVCSLAAKSCVDPPGVD